MVILWKYSAIILHPKEKHFTLLITEKIDARSVEKDIKTMKDAYIHIFDKSAYLHKSGGGTTGKSG